MDFQQINICRHAQNIYLLESDPTDGSARLYRLTGSIRPKGSPACVVMIRRMRAIPYMTASRTSPRHNRGDGATRHRQRISARISMRW